MGSMLEEVMDGDERKDALESAMERLTEAFTEAGISVGYFGRWLDRARFNFKNVKAVVRIKVDRDTAHGMSAHIVVWCVRAPQPDQVSEQNVLLDRLCYQVSRGVEESARFDLTAGFGLDEETIVCRGNGAWAQAAAEVLQYVEAYSNAYDRAH